MPVAPETFCVVVQIRRQQPAWLVRISKTAQDMTDASGSGSCEFRTLVLAVLADQAAKAVSKPDVRINLSIEHTKLQESWQNFNLQLLEAIFQCAAKQDSKTPITLVTEHLIFTQAAQQALNLYADGDKTKPDNLQVSACMNAYACAIMR